MKPYVGQVVHFKESMQAEPWAAIIMVVKRKDEIEIEQSLVDLQVFSPLSGGVHIARAVPYSEKLREKCWSLIPNQVIEEVPLEAELTDNKPILNGNPRITESTWQRN